MEKMEYSPYNHDLFQGYYGTVLYSPEMETDYNTMAYQDTKEDIEYNLNFSGYTEDMNKVITEKLMEYGVNKEDGIIQSMEYKSMWIPREFNFATERLNLEIEIDMERLRSWAEAHRQGFDKYLHVYYKPCIGWIPFVPDNYEDYMALDDCYDVMVDYYLLTNIHGTEDFHDKDIDRTDFMQDILEQVNETFSENMTPNI